MSKRSIRASAKIKRLKITKSIFWLLLARQDLNEYWWPKIFDKYDLVNSNKKDPYYIDQIHEKKGNRNLHFTHTRFYIGEMHSEKVFLLFTISWNKIYLHFAVLGCKFCVPLNNTYLRNLWMHLHYVVV